jgi:hypothetical protein
MKEDDNLDLPIAEISIQYDLELIKLRTVQFRQLLTIVANKYRNGNIQYVRDNLPSLYKSLVEIMERTGKNYCQSTEQNSLGKEREFTSKKVLNSKLFVRAFGFLNGIPLDVTDLDAYGRIQVTISEKIEKVKIEGGSPQQEDKNWTPGVLKILTGLKFKNIDRFVNNTNSAEFLVNEMINKSRLFTEDGRYSFIEDCCTQYVDALTPFAKSLELALYALENNQNKKRKFSQSCPQISSNNTLGDIFNVLLLKPVPKEQSGTSPSSNSDRIDRPKVSDRNDDYDYYI